MIHIDLESKAEFGFGCAGGLGGMSLMQREKPYLGTARKNWTERFHWFAGDRPLAVYEVAELRNLEHVSMIETQTTLKSVVPKIPIMPAPARISTELSAIPQQNLLRPLCEESAREIQKAEKRRRWLFVQNGLQAWKDDDDVLVLHTTGARGEKLSLSILEASDEGLTVDWKSLNIRTLNTVDCQSHPLNQVCVSTPDLARKLGIAGRLAAGVSTHHISLAKIEEDTDAMDFSWMLNPTGLASHSASPIADMCFNPHAFPELAFATVDGTVNVVDLDLLEERDRKACVAESEVVHCLAGSGEARTPCAYGMTPWEIYCGRLQHMKYIDLRARKAVYNVYTLHPGEEIYGLRTPASNPSSCSSLSNHLIAMQTNKNIMLFDARSVTIPTMTWRMPTAVGMPLYLDFLLDTVQPPNPSNNEPDGDAGTVELVGGEEEHAAGNGSAADNNNNNSNNNADEGDLMKESGGDNDGLDVRLETCASPPSGPTDVAIPTQMSQFKPSQSQPEMVGLSANENALSNQPRHQGSVFFGNFVRGEVAQFSFLLGDPECFLEPIEGEEGDGEDDGNEFEILKGGESADTAEIRILKADKESGDGSQPQGFPVLHERLARNLSAPSLLCSRLRGNVGFDHIAWIRIPKLVTRLREKYGSEDGSMKCVWDLDVQNWLNFIRPFPDCGGMAFVPLKDRAEERLMGLLLRQNLIGDIVVHGCRTRALELELRKKKGFQEAGKKCIDKWKTISEDWERQDGQGDVCKTLQSDLPTSSTPWGPVRTVAVENCGVKSNAYMDKRKSLPCCKNGDAELDVMISRLFDHMPTYFGHRIGSKFGRGNDPIALNYLNTYLQCKPKGKQSSSADAEVTGKWRFNEGLDETVKDAGHPVTLWELHQLKVHEYYSGIEEVDPGGGNKRGKVSEDRTHWDSPEVNGGLDEPNDLDGLDQKDQKDQKDQGNGPDSNGHVLKKEESLSPKAKDEPQSSYDLLAQVKTEDSDSSGDIYKTVVHEPKKRKKKWYFVEDECSNLFRNEPPPESMTNLAVDILVKCDMGALQPGHTRSIQKALKEADPDPNSSKRLGSYTLKLVPSIDLVLGGKRKDRKGELAKSKKRAAKVDVGLTKVWFKGKFTNSEEENEKPKVELIVKFKSSAYVQPWGFGADVDKERESIGEMKKVWENRFNPPEKKK